MSEVPEMPPLTLLDQGYVQARDLPMYAEVTIGCAGRLSSSADGFCHSCDQDYWLTLYEATELRDWLSRWIEARKTT